MQLSMNALVIGLLAVVLFCLAYNMGHDDGARERDIWGKKGQKNDDQCRLGFRCRLGSKDSRHRNSLCSSRDGFRRIVSVRDDVAIHARLP